MTSILAIESVVIVLVETQGVILDVVFEDDYRLPSYLTSFSFFLLISRFFLIVA
jgi:hypothetical protein